VKVRRFSGSVACDVVVLVRGQEMTLSCRNFSQAVKWARIECKTYKVADAFAIEQVAAAGCRAGAEDER
jgi:hypothetical protein